MAKALQIKKPLSCVVSMFRSVRSLKLPILLGTFALPAVAAEDPLFEQQVLPFLDAYCLECHDEETAKGKLSLEHIDPRIAGGPDFEKWRIILERVNFLDMPPAKADQPNQAERETLVGWIREKLLETQQLSLIHISEPTRPY